LDSSTAQTPFLDLAARATIIFLALFWNLCSVYILFTELPDRLSPSITNNDSDFFLGKFVKELPTGVSGLLVAGMFFSAAHGHV